MHQNQNRFVLFGLLSGIFVGLVAGFLASQPGFGQVERVLFLPLVMNSNPGLEGDWPQYGHDAQRTNASPTAVQAPYCYTWKWYGPPLASRAQPIVAGGRLFVGGMDGIVYARNASTGASLWRYPASDRISWLTCKLSL